MAMLRLVELGGLKILLSGATGLWVIFKPDC